jgi:ElaB/YqjD/DUF883 family membrane-anchored ribosome-binding protein
METHFKEIELQHSALARERVFADLRTLARDAEDLLKATAHDANHKTKEIRSRVMGALEQARRTCNEMQGSTAATAKATAQKAGVVVREYPYPSMGIAFALGLLIGVWVIRR